MDITRALQYDYLAVDCARMMAAQAAYNGRELADLRQIARLGLYEALDAAKTGAVRDFEAFAVRIMSRRITDAVRLVSERPMEPLDTALLPAHDDDMDAMLVRAARNERLAEAMGRLLPIERDILTRCYAEADEAKLREVGASLTPPRSYQRVYQLHTQALLRLRCWLSRDPELFT